VLAAIGDLVEDIVVHLGGPIELASDTSARIERRRGGSAANVVAAAARLTGSARLLAQVGDDWVATALLAELESDGVDVAAVRREGRTGSIVVLVDGDGERSFLTDPGVSRELDRPQPEWLDGIDVLHVPWYSLVDGRIATTAGVLIEWARARSVPVSIDLSSASVLRSAGIGRVRRQLERLRPDVVFANSDEAATIGADGAIAGALTFVKRGAAPAVVHRPGRAPVDVPAIEIDRGVDTTGAGDAFAAGVLTAATWQTDPELACAAGHTAAATLLRSRDAVDPPR
jgi:sugar/nucleoside kinase (ribokinase family)